MNRFPGLLFVAIAGICTLTLSACTQHSLSGQCQGESISIGLQIASVAKSGVLIIGETHGTNEIPVIFHSIVCAVIERGNEIVVVGLELPPDALSIAKKATDAGDEDERMAVLERSRFWQKARDGRTSEAYFDLIRKLVALEREGKIALVGFDMRLTGAENFSQLAFTQIADEVERNHGNEDAFVVLLTGNGHASFHNDSGSLGGPFANLGYVVEAVALTHSSGSAWVCSAGSCGPRPIRSVVGCKSDLERSMAARTVRTMCIGSVTPSPPQVGE